MIDNNALGNRLNEFKLKKEQNSSSNNLLTTTFNTLYLIIVLLFKTFVFGYSIKIILKTGWNFWEIMCIGLAINFILTYLDELIHNKD